MTTIGFSFCSRALRRTYFVCGIGPSNASTSRRTPSTMLRTRSTSPPKSAWPGVSTMLILMPLYMMAVFFERIVMPRSRSISPESMTRSATCSFERNTWLCFSMASTSVVLPWSTCAMIAILRSLSLVIILILCNLPPIKEKGYLSYPHLQTKITHLLYMLSPRNAIDFRRLPRAAVQNTFVQPITKVLYLQ